MFRAQITLLKVLIEQMDYELKETVNIIKIKTQDPQDSSILLIELQDVHSTVVVLKYDYCMHKQDN